MINAHSSAVSAVGTLRDVSVDPAAAPSRRGGGPRRRFRAGVGRALLCLLRSPRLGGACVLWAPGTSRTLAHRGRASVSVTSPPGVEGLPSGARVRSTYRTRSALASQQGGRGARLPSVAVTGTSGPHGFSGGGDALPVRGSGFLSSLSRKRWPRFLVRGTRSPSRPRPPRPARRPPQS